MVSHTMNVINMSEINVRAINANMRQGGGCIAVSPVEPELLSQLKVVDRGLASPKLTEEFVGGGLTQRVGHEHKPVQPPQRRQ